MQVVGGPDKHHLQRSPNKNTVHLHQASAGCRDRACVDPPQSVDPDTHVRDSLDNLGLDSRARVSLRCRPRSEESGGPHPLSIGRLASRESRQTGSFLQKKGPPTSPSGHQHMEHGPEGDQGRERCSLYPGSLSCSWQNDTTAGYGWGCHVCTLPVARPPEPARVALWSRAPCVTLSDIVFNS